MESAAPSVPLVDKKFDFAQLGRKLRRIKERYPKTQSVYIAADGNIPYEVIVATLDASRSDARGELFPVVAFTQIN